MTGILAHVPEGFLKVHDHAKREAGALIGIALTEIGASATRCFTWPSIGRYIVCGGGLFSSFIFAQLMIWKGKRRAGYQLSMASAVGTVGAAWALNFTPIRRVSIIAGSGMVFISSLNRYNDLKKRTTE